MVTKNVTDYALVTGNPARQTGWMSEQGEKLVFNENGEATCKISGVIYKLNNSVVEKINNE